MNTKTTKKKLENLHFLKKAGTTSYLKVEWKSFKKELPPTNEVVWVIIRLTNGYYTTLGEYIKDRGDSDMDFDRIRFYGEFLPETFIKSKDGKRLIAWGAMEDFNAKYILHNK